jgi:hypothetical protein
MKNLFWWLKDQLQIIEISDCKLTDQDISYLFMTNLKVWQLDKLIKLKFYNN